MLRRFTVAALLQNSRLQSRGCTYSTITHNLQTTESTGKKYLIQTAVLLNRSPVLTRSPTSFEAALYQYNSNIGRALFNPFPYDFYFNSGSLLKAQFNKEEKLREKLAFNWAKKTVSKRSTPPSSKTPKTTQYKPSLSPATTTSSDDDAQPMSRTTEADKINDVKSLNRQGHRNLYLLVKRGEGEWRLPGARGDLRDGELLHEAAKRELHAECGINMDAWVVGRHPIGVMDAPLPQELQSSQYGGAKIFFFKVHILAGQIDPTIANLKDFAWLTKEEIKKIVTLEYWNNIHNILSEY
ncbi:hypothetical protein Clacol_006751 [Clathrus columnatus]|uniref:Large ribosomal subunit protein mL46 n=1 Tax=Clathrus columnatus TaxID=1419009 RepID=A0AAV5AIJ0_9AGAM|nr:hypothetical protein Clacol_006751 [Clathrus columnatus]